MVVNRSLHRSAGEPSGHELVGLPFCIFPCAFPVFTGEGDCLCNVLDDSLGGGPAEAFGVVPVEYVADLGHGVHGVHPGDSPVECFVGERGRELGVEVGGVIVDIVGESFHVMAIGVLPCGVELPVHLLHYLFKGRVAGYAELDKVPYVGEEGLLFLLSFYPLDGVVIGTEAPCGLLGHVGELVCEDPPSGAVGEEVLEMDHDGDFLRFLPLAYVDHDVGKFLGVAEGKDFHGGACPVHAARIP